MPLLDEVKLHLRIAEGTTAYDAEVQLLIDAAQADLKLSGVDPELVDAATDPLIRRAIIIYAKAHFGYDNPDAERLAGAYDMLKAHLSLSQDYRATEQAVEGS